MTNETNPGTIVIQDDRIAAADLLDEVSALLDHVGIGQVADLIRDGEYDEHEATIAFARHRLAAQSQPAATVQEVGREALLTATHRLALAAGALNVATDGMLRVRKQREDVLAALKALAALTAEPAAKAGPVAKPNDTTMRHMADQFLRLMGLTDAYNDWLANGGGLPASAPSNERRDRVIMSSVRLGKWMSAALDDPNVCEEMKTDIRDWFSAGEPVVGWAAAPSTLPHKEEATSATTERGRG